MNFQSCVAFCLIICCLIPAISALECYRNNVAGYEVENVVCNSVSQPYCLKANVYDGSISRDCATARQCPQGNACSPITYSEDGTTDYVCCCNSNYCNSAPITLPLLTTFVWFVGTTLMLTM